MKDMDEKYQLLINCKADESSNEEIIYNFNNNGDFGKVAPTFISVSVMK
jgi:hypothetical protein